MDFQIPTDVEEFRREVKDFISTQPVKQLAEERKRTGSKIGLVCGPLSWEFWRKLADKGWLGISIEKQYGGQNKPLLYLIVLLEELLRADVPSDPETTINVIPSIMESATEEQKQDILPRYCQGEITYALGYTEPDAGTDLASLKTSAVRQGESYIINGEKIFCSGAHAATHIFLAVRTDPKAEKHAGISLLSVPLNSPGITIEPLWTMSGTRVNQVFFDNVQVPKSTLVGEENNGWTILTGKGLAWERGTAFLQWIVEDEKVLYGLVDYAKTNAVRGKVLADDARVKEKLADLVVFTEILRLIYLKWLWAVQQKMDLTRLSCIIKIWQSEHRQRIARVGAELMGQYGQLEIGSQWAPLNGKIMWLYMASPFLQFGAGPNEVLRGIIAREVLSRYPA